MAPGPDFHLAAGGFQASQGRFAGGHFTFPCTDFGGRDIAACADGSGLTQATPGFLQATAGLFCLGSCRGQLPGNQFVIQLDQHIAPVNTITGFHPNLVQQARNRRRHARYPKGIHRTIQGHFLNDIF